MQKFFVFVEVNYLVYIFYFGLKETEAQSNKAISESILEIFCLKWQSKLQDQFLCQYAYYTTGGVGGGGPLRGLEISISSKQASKSSGQWVSARCALRRFSE